MQTLTIEGVIGRKEDAALAPNEKFFSYSDLENFLDSYDGGPFEVVIKSPGGSVEEGFKIYNKLKGLDVTTVAITANSIASVIFLAGKVRKITPSSEVIIHNAWVDAKDLAGEKLNFHTLKALTELFAETDLQILAVYTGIAGPDKAGKLLALMAQETNVSADLALDLGFATEVSEADYKARAFRNRVLTFSQNQIKILNIQDGPVTTYADVILVNEEGKVLLLLRTETDEFEPGKWCFPGGKVMQGETPKAGALRELEEETGLKFGDAELLVDEVNEDESLTHYYFRVMPSDISQDVTVVEHNSADWFSAEEVEGLDVLKDQNERFTNLIKQVLKLTQMKTEEKLNAFEKALSGLKNLFKSQLKNMAAVTKEGVAIFIAGAEDGELVGKTVYLAEEGLPTETLAPEGVHVLEDGTSVTLDAAGVITEVTAPAPVEDVEALKAAYEEEKKAMQEEKVELEAKVEAQAKVIADTKKQLNALISDFANLKNQVLGDPDDKEKKTGLMDPAEFAKLPTSEKIRLRAMAKA